MGASLDYRTSTTHLPVEIKNVDGFQFRTTWAGENEDGSAKVVVPMHYQIQLQHQIACSAAGTPGGWIVACVGGNHIDRFYFERNDELIAQIEVSITEFWESIDAREEPSPDFEQDADAIAKLFSKAGTSTVDLTGDNHIPVLCADYVKGMEQEKAGKAAKRAAKAAKGTTKSGRSATKKAGAKATSATSRTGKKTAKGTTRRVVSGGKVSSRTSTATSRSASKTRSGSTPAGTRKTAAPRRMRKQR